MSNDNSLSLPELNKRIAILQNNIRQLVQQAAGSVGARDEERISDRIAQQNEELEKLTSPAVTQGLVCGSFCYSGSGLSNAHQWTPQSHLEARPDHRSSRDLPAGSRCCASVPK